MRLSFGQRHEIFEQLQSDALAFFRMKLRGEDVIFPHRRRERPAVVGASGHDGWIARLREKAVHEIDVTAARDPIEQRAGGLGDLDLVPADLRNLEAGLFGEADDLAGKNPQPGRATVKFLALLEQRLVTNADAEKGP